MTNAINDRLQKTLNGLNVDSRLGNWLWHFLKGQAPHANLGELGSPGMRDRIADLIQNTPTGAEFVEAQSAMSLLPEKDLEWITNNKRQNLFVARKLIEKNGNYPIIGTTTLSGRPLTITTIDIWTVEISKKLWLVNQIKFEWEQHSSSDHIFKWLDGADATQKLETAWEITKSKHPMLTFQQSIPKEKDDFITLLDSQFISKHEKILLMDSIKKRWSQNKYRAKLTGKKQYNFILSDKAINRLDKLADKYDLKRTEVLEILLQMEEEKGTYIQEKKSITKGIT
ncbi:MULTISPECIES: hypothetical protein [Pseudomonas]|uniref:hypothetical protein n=1 Tax=Pseudomonas TaxID=286 RepID=UPI001660F55E|nr:MULTISPECIES: hypothetical protein [Pseudomonas]MCZ7716124.1 hypothetical protein [Pseudomonas aeruginosa]MCZ7820965.1 hypothetical protein [Pseudomonas aeruginosa]MDD2013877.1 hypothetical protein [Pseudomonas putida]HDS1773872.1 hypothetical protein [Pseudomonas putida]